MLGTSFLRPLARAAAAATVAGLAAAAPLSAQQPTQTALTFTGAATSAGYAGYAVGPLLGIASFAATPSMPGSTQGVTLFCVDFLHAAQVGETFTANVSAIATSPGALALTRQPGGLAGYRRAVWLADQFGRQPQASWGGIQSAIWKIFGSGSLDGNAVKSNGVAVANDSRNEVYWTAQANTFAASTAFATYDYARYAVYTDVNAPNGGRQEFLGRAAVVPEPGTLALVGAGAAGLAGWAVRRRGRA
jgi:hypothetical protein